MNSICFFNSLKYSELMKNAKDKKIFRMQMVQYAIKYGNKPAARHFNTTVKTIRKWRKRYTDEKYQGLEDRSHAPHNPVQYTSDLEKRFVCWVKENHTGFGASFVKEKYNLDMSELAIRKAWRGEKLLKKRKRKHETKQDLREMKKKWKLFEQFDVDVKYLTDIPKLFIPIQQGLVPKYQYTFRDVVSGLMYIAYSETYGMMESCLFIETILEHLKSCGIDLSKSRCQTDNGSEFIGSWNKKGDSEFTKTLERYKVEHRTIPPGAHSWQSDVETVHYTIEIHFYDNESYQHENDFLRKASSYVLYYNSRHKNKSKDKKTPWDIIQERDKTIPKKILNFMPFRIDYYFEQMPIASGGYHLIKSP